MLRRLVIMRPRSVVYPICIIYEFIRLLLLQQSAFSTNSATSLGWYSGIGLMCLVPILFFMLFLDEQQFHLWLPLIALTKALGIPGFMLYIFRTLPEA